MMLTQANDLVLSSFREITNTGIGCLFRDNRGVRRMNLDLNGSAEAHRGFLKSSEIYDSRMFFSPALESRR
jgi:hypothetical protein